MSFSKLILFPGYSSFNRPLSEAEFANIAATAQKSGFTHIDLGCAMTGRARWQLPDNGVWSEGYDFYPEYTAVFPSFFKFFVPEKLRKYIPVDFADANIGRLTEFAGILERLGLKGSFVCSEPLFLPDAAFADHPEWRGPRCDFAWRSKKGYYAPCVDQPEILDFYREASREIGKAAPMIDYIEAVTADSGAGLCWGKLYPGANGPDHCREIAAEQRENTFLKALKVGFRDVSCAGITVQPNWTYTGMMPFTTLQGSDQVYLLRVPQDKPLVLESPLAVLNGLDRAAEAGATAIRFSIEDPRSLFKKGELYPEIFKSFKDIRCSGNTDQLLRLNEFVKKIEPQADSLKLCDGWLKLDEALRTLERCFISSIMFYGSMSERWLVRPLLAMPERVPYEEKLFFHQHIFNVLGAEAEDDLLDYHGNRWSRIATTATAADRSVQVLEYISDLLAEAENSMKSSCSTPIRTARVSACRCFVRNIKNILRFQAQLDRVRDALRTASSDVMTLTVTDEYYNTLRLIELLEKFPDLIMRSDQPEDENTFQYGPELLAQLREKNRLMMERIHDIDDIVFDREAVTYR